MPTAPYEIIEVTSKRTAGAKDAPFHGLAELLAPAVSAAPHAVLVESHPIVSLTVQQRPGLTTSCSMTEGLLPGEPGEKVVEESAYTAADNQPGAKKSSRNEILRRL